MSASSEASNLSFDAKSIVDPGISSLDQILPELVGDLISKHANSFDVDRSYSKSANINQKPTTSMTQAQCISLNKANALSFILYKGHTGNHLSLREVLTLLISHRTEHPLDSQTTIEITETINNLVCQYDNRRSIHCTQVISEIQNCLRHVSLPNMDAKFSRAINNMIATKRFDYNVALGENKSLTQHPPLPDLWDTLQVNGITPLNRLWDHYLTVKQYLSHLYI